MCAWTLLVFHFGFWAAIACLPDAVPEMDLSYIKDDMGNDVEIKLVACDWPSAEFVTILSNQA